MKKLAVSSPTAIGAVSFELPPDSPIPPTGVEFYYNFKSVATELKEWKAVRSARENNSLTVEKVESGTVILREGVHPNLPAIESEVFLPVLQLYWEQNLWTSPPGF